MDANSIEKNIEKLYLINIFINEFLQKYLQNFPKLEKFKIRETIEKNILIELYKINDTKLNDSNLHINLFKIINEKLNEDLCFDDKNEFTFADTKRTFLYKKFKKLLNDKNYTEIIKENFQSIDINNIRLLLLQSIIYVSIIQQRKYVYIIEPASYNDIIKKANITIDGFSSIFIPHYNNIKYCSINPYDYGSLGCIFDLPFDVFINQNILIHPPAIYEILTRTIEWINHITFYINKLNYQSVYDPNNIPNKIKIMFICPIMDYYKDELMNDNIFTLLQTMKEKIFESKAKKYNYYFYDYNGMLKQINDNVYLKLFTFKIG